MSRSARKHENRCWAQGKEGVTVKAVALLGSSSFSQLLCSRHEIEFDPASQVGFPPCEVRRHQPVASQMATERKRPSHANSCASTAIPMIAGFSYEVWADVAHAVTRNQTKNTNKRKCSGNVGLYRDRWANPALGATWPCQHCAPGHKAGCSRSLGEINYVFMWVFLL